jgi:hypothetical protein
MIAEGIVSVPATPLEPDAAVYTWLAPPVSEANAMVELPAQVG